MFQENCTTAGKLSLPFNYVVIIIPSTIWDFCWIITRLPCFATVDAHAYQFLAKASCLVITGAECELSFVYCSLCNVKNVSKSDLVAHLRGKKHARHMNETSDEEESD
jgi:hypothetical protein